MKKWIILFVTIMVGASATGCGGTKKEIKELRLEISEVRGKVDKLSKQVSEDKKDENTKVTEETVVENSQDNTYQAYIDMQFPKDGKTYVLSKYSTEGQKFYSDVNCTEEIPTPEFCSESIQSGTAPNTLNIYCFRTTNNTIVYSPDRPSLVDKAEQNQ